MASIGNPKSIGIDDLALPDFGDAVPLLSDEVPVFWACGLTPLRAHRKPGQSELEFSAYDPGIGTRRVPRRHRSSPRRRSRSF